MLPSVFPAQQRPVLVVNKTVQMPKPSWQSLLAGKIARVDDMVGRFGNEILDELRKEKTIVVYARPHWLLWVNAACTLLLAVVVVLK